MFDVRERGESLMMSLRNRLGALFLATLLAAFWALTRERAGGGPRPPAPIAAAAAPPEPAAPPVTVKKKRRPKIAAKAPDARDENLVAEDERKQSRGARLREKGEALGGDGTQRRMAREEKAAETADRIAPASAQ